MQRYLHNPFLLQAIILFIAALFLFWNSGTTDIYEWDEARNGVNAWNMYHNHDYVNNYYGGELDTWTAKPPLLIWLITISYKIFGFNEFALRLPAMLGSFIFFIVLFRLVRMFHTSLAAFLTCIILLSCRAIAAHHVGRTGDYDSLLLLFLTCSVYFLCTYLYRQKLSGLYLAAVFTGLAFYAKGTAGFLYLPGIFLFLLVTRQLMPLLRSYHTYIALTIMLAIIGSWVVLVSLYGKTSANSFYGTSNSLEALFVHDTYKRLMVKDEHFYALRDNFFFFHTIEVRMNMWHILYYMALATGIVTLFRHRQHIGQIIFSEDNRFTLLSLCLSMPIILLLNFSEQPWEWYFTPVWAFVAFITARWMIYAAGKWQPLAYIWVAVILFNLVKHFMYINTEKQMLHKTLTRANPAFQTDYIVLLDNPRENLMLYTHFLGVGFHKATTDEELQQEKGRTAIIYTHRFDAAKFEKLQEFDEYVLARVR